MSYIVHHDFETFSRVDIKKAGGYKYARSSTTEVLMLSFALPGETPQLWVPAEGEPMPAILKELVADPGVTWAAFNAQFERLIWNHVLRADIPISQFYCVMQHAWYLSFAGNLHQVGAQVGIAPDKRKMEDGRKLIQRFCGPAPRNHKADRYDRFSHPEEWDRFKQYCVQDTIAEREIEALLADHPWPESEQALWRWDQDVNDRGIPIDLDLVNRAVKIDHIVKERTAQELNSLTGLVNGNSNVQLKPWLEARVGSIPNMQAETLKRLYESTTDPLVRQVVAAKIQASKTSVRKWEAFKVATDDDGLLRGMFQFGGAQRTQRWAGRIVQLHNLKTPEVEDPVGTVDALYLAADILEAIYGSPLDLLSQLVRCAITAPDDYQLGPVDLSSIESRVLGHLSGCRRINSIFAAGLDTYKDFATEYYHVAYEQVTKAMRKFCKPPVLGCGYRLGWKGLIEYAAGMGVNMDPKQSQTAVRIWRDLFDEVPDMWNWLETACHDVVENWTTHEGYGVRIRRDINFMMIDLPTRTMYYNQPLILAQVPPWERERIEAGEIEEQDARTKPTLTYLGQDQNTRKWCRLSSHSGKTTENIVQGYARDILAYHMQEIEAELGPIIRGHVHDEAIPLLPEERALDMLHTCEEIMSVPPPWAPGLLLGAKGFLTKRYTKD